MTFVERLASADIALEVDKEVKNNRAEKSRGIFGTIVNKVAIPAGGTLVSNFTNWSLTGLIAAASLREGIANDLSPERALALVGVANFVTLFARSKQEVNLLEEVDTSPGMTSTVVYTAAKKISPENTMLRKTGAIAANMGGAFVTSVPPIIFSLHSDAAANLTTAYFAAGTIINSAWWSINKGALEIARRGKKN